MMILWVVAAFAIERSTTKVFINGTRYYIHTVADGETLYALAATYAVSEAVILEHNPALKEGLKAGDRLRIPDLEPAAPVTKTTAPTRDAKATKRLKKTFAIHYVSAGETLFAIARMYEISVQTIIEDNPEIDPAHLAVDQQILIRKKQIGKSSEEESLAEWEAYNAQLNSVATQGEDYYVVQQGDTFYSLARRLGITQEQLSELNGGLQAADLKAGAIIKLPEPERVAEEQTAAAQREADRRRLEKVEVDFRAHCDCDPLRVALLLPMSTAGEPNANYIDFYEGFLLGLDSVRTRYGHSVDLHLYDTKRDTGYLHALIASDEDFARAQLIVGPVYEEEVRPVVAFSEQKVGPVPVISPLAHITRTQSDVLFQMAPDPMQKYAKATDLVAEGKRVTLIYTERTDKEFEAEMLQLLGDRPYEKYEYRYVHPSVKLKEGEVNPSDLSPLLQNDEENLFIVMADNEIEVDRILAALASADTNLRARSLAQPDYRVLGNSRWNRYQNIDRTIFFKNRVIFFSTYHAKRDQQLILDFDRAYIRAFGSLPSLYSYRGYDAAMIFVTAMFNDIEYDLEDRRYAPLVTPYRFEQEESTHNHINTAWVRVNYHPDFTITIE